MYVIIKQMHTLHDFIRLVIHNLLHNWVFKILNLLSKILNNYYLLRNNIIMQ